MEIELYKINSFSDRFDGGNPAGVCPLSQWLDDADMQAIAKENGFSETAFFVANGDAYDLRWFTPGCEVDLCGHATLASAFVLARELQVEKDVYRFNTRSGLINVFEKSGLLTLDMPASSYQPAECPPSLIQGLGKAPEETYLADDYLLVFEDETLVQNLEPDFEFMKHIQARGTIVTACSEREGVDFVSRWFGGPDVGIDEDPVTGSAHCMLVPYWSRKLEKTNLVAEQLSERGGRLVCATNGDRVEVSGSAVTYFKGVIYL